MMTDTKTEENWKQVEDYENYEVSDLGNVRNNKTGRILRSFLNKVGYVTATLCKNSKPRHFKVHRLVANAFLDRVDGKDEIDHINNIKTDNRVENLRWVTRSENNRNCKKKNSSTGFTGVTKNGKGFRARCSKDGVAKSLGTFKTAEEAFEAYKKFAEENGFVIYHLTININSEVANVEIQKNQATISTASHSESDERNT